MTQTGNARLLRNPEWRAKRREIFMKEVHCVRPGTYRKRFGIGSTPLGHLKKRRERKVNEKNG